MWWVTFVNWNHTSVTEIRGVTWCIFVHICPTIRDGFDIVCVKPWTFFLQSLHAINKTQLCCSVFSIKTCLKLVLHVGELVWPFVNFFVSFLCLRLFIIFSICLRDFLIRFETNFHYCPLISHSVFWSFSDRRNFTLIIAMTAKAIACI